MRKILSKVCFLSVLILSLNVSAQVASGASTTALGFTADVGDLVEKGKVSDFTNKYDGYLWSKVFFNFNKVKLLVYKSSVCELEVCPAIAEVPMVVEFDVKRVEYQGCYVTYYAKTPDSVKATYQEKLIIHRFASERCQSIAEMPEGTLHYKIEGYKADMSEVGEAHVFSKLKNVKLIYRAQ